MQERACDAGPQALQLIIERFKLRRTMTAQAGSMGFARPRMGTLAALVGVAPFFIFSVLFLVLPLRLLVAGAFEDANGAFTLANFGELFSPTIASAYLFSIEISAASAILGAVFGTIISAAVILGGLPTWMRSSVATFSGVASNFAGVPLAFAFVETIGRIGLVTTLLRNGLGVDIYRMGFNLLSSWGLTVTYLYFQIPLMVLIITPAIEGLRQEWREAAESLGASALDYWLRIAVPILLPSFIGATLLLFANSFGAVATAYALSTGFPIITLQLFAQIRGDVLHNENLGYAIAVGMIVLTAVSNVGYIWLRSRADRWVK
jgi:putative spermidine/putrescine transport system permease protein